ncbi:unnamed protein product [Closterium sp. NIES-65]|nr:unnamed protein product [Closterium sp. NIES-65]
MVPSSTQSDTVDALLTTAAAVHPPTPLTCLICLMCLPHPSSPTTVTMPHQVTFSPNCSHFSLPSLSDLPCHTPHSAHITHQALHHHYFPFHLSATPAPPPIHPPAPPPIPLLTCHATRLTALSSCPARHFTTTAATRIRTPSFPSSRPLHQANGWVTRGMWEEDVRRGACRASGGSVYGGDREWANEYGCNGAIPTFLSLPPRSPITPPTFSLSFPHGGHSISPSSPSPPHIPHLLSLPPPSPLQQANVTYVAVVRHGVTIRVTPPSTERRSQGGSCCPNVHSTMAGPAARILWHWVAERGGKRDRWRRGKDWKAMERGKRGERGREGREGREGGESGRVVSAGPDAVAQQQAW